MKPERKSRVTSVELEKARADQKQQEEATNLLHESKLMERKIIGINNERTSKYV